jgi:hypothetical protein
MYVYSIVPGVHAIIATNPNSLIICGDMLVNGGDQLVSISTGSGGNGKVIHLTAYQHSLAINSASVQVSFMSGRPEIEFLSFKDANNHLLSQHTSLRMTLKCPMHRNNILAWINIIAKSFTIPRAVGVVNLKVAWLSRRRRLLVSILGVSEDNDKTQCGRQGIEQSHARLLNAGGIRLDILMKSGRRSVGTVHTGMTLPSTISLDNILPMDT